MAKLALLESIYNKQSLVDKIRSDIEGDVMSGQLSPGQRIPYEHELMETYSCSRMTVNRALSGLVEKGMLERRKRAGTFVAIPRVHRALIEFPDVRTEVIDLGKDYLFTIIEKTEREATAFDRLQLNVEAGSVMKVDCLHYADGNPYAYEQRIINLNAVPEARDANFDRDPPGCWLFEHVRWSDARHTISAFNADSDIAGKLSVQSGQACLQIERWTWRDRQNITYVKQIHAANLYALKANFRR